MYPLINLIDKRIVIAGASHGIGRDTAILLSRLGARVWLIARNEEKLKDVILNMEGENHGYDVFDLSDLEHIDGLVEKIVAKFGPVNGLVYCAGKTDNRPLMQMKPVIFESVTRLNLDGFVELSRCLTKRKRFEIGMSIVGISSVAAIQGEKAHAAYAASKAGMNGAMRCMAKELAGKGIRVNTVAPGMIDTEMYEDYLQVSGGPEGDANLQLKKRQYLGIGETIDVANAIAFLLSPAARFITGICLPVDGGSTSC